MKKMVFKGWPKACRFCGDEIESPSFDRKTTDRSEICETCKQLIHGTLSMPPPHPYAKNTPPKHEVGDMVWVNYYGKWLLAKLTGRKQRHEGGLYYWNYQTNLPELARRGVCEDFLSKFLPDEEVKRSNVLPRGKKDE